MDETNRLLRERFDNIDAKELAAMQERHEEESFNLDFKRINPTGELSDDDKGNLRKAISGFANSAGGIILWGVDTKKTEQKKKGEPEDRSRFQSLVPVANGERVAVRFHELTATATQPAVSGVVHGAIKVSGGWIIKTFVPASDGGPHRTNEDKGQYYRRDADAFRAMQHHEIADMFGRRLRPKLEIYRSRLAPNTELRDQSELIIGITNVGRGIARFPRVVLIATLGQVFAHRYGLDGNGKTNLNLDAASPASKRIALTGGADTVIHPSQTLEITKLGLKPTFVDGERSVRLEYSICAEGMQTVDGVLHWHQIDFGLMSNEPL